MFERAQNNKNRFSLADIITVNKGTEPGSDQRILFRKTCQNHFLRPLTTPNLPLEQEEERQKQSEPFSNFQNKLLNFLKINEQHAKNAAKYFQRNGMKKSNLLLKVKKKSNKFMTEPGHNDKDKKKKSIKQYMAEVSLQKRRKYESQSSHSEDIRESNGKEKYKSNSVLIVRKVQNKNDQEEREDYEFPNSKVPIHHTQAYFFQKNKTKTEQNLSDEPPGLSMGNTKTLKTSNEGLINLKYDEMNKYHSIVKHSRILENNQLMYFQNQKDHNFIKRKRNITSKALRTSEHPKPQFEAKEEEVDGDIGPWKRRITVDIELP